MPARVGYTPSVFSALLNARDLGGFPTPDGAITRRRTLVRADDLAHLSPEGLEALAAYGVETVLDLRWPEEIAAAPSPVAQLPGVRLRRHGDSDPADILEAVRCPEAAVYNMLQHLERGSGVRAYLARIGLGSDEIARLRARLRETP